MTSAAALTPPPRAPSTAETVVRWSLQYVKVFFDQNLVDYYYIYD